MKVQKYPFQVHGDERGQLIAIEELKETPFEIKRIYYMYDTKENVRRGYHSHRSLEQILVCVHGSCKIVFDDGYERKEVILDRPDEGVYVGPNIWREMSDFSSDAVLMVLASQPYDEKDYIRDYTQFIESVKGKNEEG